MKKSWEYLVFMVFYGMWLHLPCSSAWALGFNFAQEYYDSQVMWSGGLNWGEDFETGYDRQKGIGAMSQIDWQHSTGLVSFEGFAGPYDLRGKLTSYGSAEWLYAAGESRFWDEIYFETATGDPAELVFNFNLHVDFSLPESMSPHVPSPTAIDPYRFEVGFGTQRVDEDGDPIWDHLQNRPLGGVMQSEFFYDDFDGLLSFSTLNDMGWGPGFWQGDTVLSGSYLPIYFSTDSRALLPGISIDWLNTFQLFSIDAYLVDEQGMRGRQLFNNEFTVYSTSQSIPEPIPEPTTIVLLGTGLAGIAGAARRRRKNQA